MLGAAAMSPLHFSIDELVPISPQDFATRLLDLNHWQSFAGYGSIPAIKSAVEENRTPAIIGTAIRITNADASTCLATITEWHPDYRVAIKTTDLTPPLSDSITSIEETWDLEPEPDGQTRITRLVQIFPKSDENNEEVERVALDLKKAMLMHLHQLKESTTPAGYTPASDEPGLLNDPHQAMVT
jgi:hypothetical protein